MIKFPQRSEVYDRLVAALDHLVSEDIYLLENGVHERAVTHKLAEYLKLQFPKWDVDCEYNKDGPDTKTLFIPGYDLKLGDHPVYPDIIVHQRGDWRYDSIRPHLLVVEARDDDQGKEKIARDTTKVEAYMSELRYQFGALVEYWFEDGKASYEIDFRPEA